MRTTWASIGAQTSSAQLRLTADVLDPVRDNTHRYLVRKLRPLRLGPVLGSAQHDDGQVRFFSRGGLTSLDRLGTDLSLRARHTGADDRRWEQTTSA